MGLESCQVVVKDRNYFVSPRDSETTAGQEIVLHVYNQQSIAPLERYLLCTQVLMHDLTS
jgi:hypothetical protein